VGQAASFPGHQPIWDAKKLNVIIGKNRAI
jgi:hypothetical protein